MNNRPVVWITRLRGELVQKLLSNQSFSDANYPIFIKLENGVNACYANSRTTFSDGITYGTQLTITRPIWNLKKSGVASGFSRLFAPLIFLMIRKANNKIVALKELPDGRNPWKMSEIRILFHITAPREKVYEALTTIDGLAGWWTKQTCGDSRPGGIIRFRFGELGNDMAVWNKSKKERFARCFKRWNL